MTPPAGSVIFVIGQKFCPAASMIQRLLLYPEPGKSFTLSAPKFGPYCTWNTINFPEGSHFGLPLLSAPNTCTAAAEHVKHVLLLPSRFIVQTSYNPLAFTLS